MINEVIQRICDRSKSCQNADFLPNILGKYCHDATSGQIQVVLFGAGSAGVNLENALKIHDVNIICFCDNHPNKVGTQCTGHPVISAERLRQDHLEGLIVISASWPYSQQIKEQLLQLGFPPDRIRTPLLDPLLYYTNVVSLYWPPDDLQTYGPPLQDTYHTFSDRKSKDLFLHRMALLTGGFDYNSFQQFIQAFADLISDPSPNLFSSPRKDDDYFYFHSDFFPLTKGEVFANVGAWVGDCAIEFAKSCQARGLKYKEIINFEPDPDNFRQLSVNMIHLANARCLQYGLWSCKSHLGFSNPGKSGGDTAHLDNNGNLEVEVVSLDELLPDAEISLIKMDVEGAEIEALRGAANTIKRNKPKLAISVYHKRNDIFDIPLFIHHLHPGYKLYLRHHSTTFGETILFAVP